MNSPIANSDAMAAFSAALGYATEHLTSGEIEHRKKFHGHSSLCNRFRDSGYKRGKWVVFYNNLRKCTCYLSHNDQAHRQPDKQTLPAKAIKVLHPAFGAALWLGVSVLLNNDRNI